MTGPDEYKAVVNNNTYTNLMARENLRYAIEVVERIQAQQPQMLEVLKQKTGLQVEPELEDWRRAANNMYIPCDAATGIYPQDERSSIGSRGTSKILLPTGIRCCCTTTL